MPPVEPSFDPHCARRGTCAMCKADRHKECLACHGCGCVRSAQHAAHVHTTKGMLR